MIFNKYKNQQKGNNLTNYRDTFPLWRIAWLSLGKKKFSQIGGGLLLLILTLTSACEDEIRPELEDAPEIVAIDAWINNKPEPQVIRVNGTQQYFDNSVPAGLSGAIVQVIDENQEVYDFLETASGEYTWTPEDGETFGRIGLQYGLNIEYDGVTYNAISKMNGVPPVDSITFEFEEEEGPFPEGYFGEFWARDLAGAGDTYWIKAFKNGQYLGKPSEINIAFDAGFSNGGNIDGLIFIPPIRFGVNAFEDDEDGEFLPSYVPGDSLYVEIHSITNEAFFFLTEVRVQTDRPGGFAELFATPLSNVVTNIAPSDQNTEVVGFFNVSAVSGNGKRLIE
ncbi:MAG: DUF4249 family protein [Bacteroidota bacterium]